MITEEKKPCTQVGKAVVKEFIEQDVQSNIAWLQAVFFKSVEHQTPEYIQKKSSLTFWSIGQLSAVWLGSIRKNGILQRQATKCSVCSMSHTAIHRNCRCAKHACKTNILVAMYFFWVYRKWYHKVNL